MIPHGVDNYLISCIRPKPDLYGPFWVCLTLTFAIAISGNIADYVQTAGNSQWKYDFHMASYAATFIFSYAWLIPLILWGAIKWSKSAGQTTNTDNELIEVNFINIILQSKKTKIVSNLIVDNLRISLFSLNYSGFLLS